MRFRTAASALVLLLAASSPARAAMTNAFVFQSDYVSGSLSRHTLAPRTAQCDVASVGSDASLRWWGGSLYVVNRYGGDNVQVIDPATGATQRQFSVGAGSNPHDIAFKSATHAYVTRYDATDLWVVDPSTGAHTGTISLARFGDSDGLPEMDRLMMVGPLLFVSLERIDRNNGYAPLDTSLVAVIDTRADTLLDCDPARPGIQAIALRLRNPFTAFQFDADSSRLLIGCVGNFGVADGGVERIDPVRLASTGVAVTEAALGGDVNDVVWGSAARSWAIVADALGNTSLVSWSAAAGATPGVVTATLWNPGGYVLADAKLSDAGELWVCDNSFASPRVRVFAAATGAASGADITCSLPAVAVTFDATSDGVGGVTPDAPASAAAFAAPWPAPARGPVHFAFTLPRGGHVRLDVFDAAGRRVRTLADGLWPAGDGAASWDLADDGGARVAPGVYFAHLRAADVALSRRVIVVR